MRYPPRYSNGWAEFWSEPMKRLVDKLNQAKSVASPSWWVISSQPWVSTRVEPIKEKTKKLSLKTWIWSHDFYSLFHNWTIWDWGYFILRNFFGNVSKDFRKSATPVCVINEGLRGTHIFLYACQYQYHIWPIYDLGVFPTWSLSCHEWPLHGTAMYQNKMQ